MRNPAAKTAKKNGPGPLKKGRTEKRGHRSKRRRLRILITAGPTREYFDSVRFISNPSSGRMGYAIAEAAQAAGHKVTLVSGPVSLRPPAGVRVVAVESAAEMASAAKAAFKAADAAILVAAVCDYRPARRARLKKPKSRTALPIKLVPTEDIAAALGRRKGGRITIGFAMEDHAARPHAVAKLERKNCDAIVLNGPENVDSSRASVEFLVRGGRWRRWRPAPKHVIAKRIIRELEILADDAS